MGFTIVRKGRYLSIKEHDSVRIDPVKNCFWRNSRIGTGNAVGKGGSIIDFFLEFTDLTLHEVLKRLSEEVFSAEGMSNLPNFRKEEKRRSTLCLPKPDEHMHNLYAYLIQTRKIKREIVQAFVDQKLLYQDIHKNCVFVGYDRKNKNVPVFACLRGTNTYKPFYGDVPGCDYEQCFYYSNGADQLYITESVLETMSVMSLLDQPDQFDYLALAGVGKADCVKSYLDHPWKEIWIGTNQDDKGRMASDYLKEYIRTRRPDISIVVDLPEGEGNDWNDILKKRRITG